MENKSFVNKFVSLFLTVFSLISCGNQVKNKDWNDNERKIISDHLYNVELPKPKVDGLPELVWNEASNGATLFGGTSTSKILDEYATKFSSEWEVTKFDSDIEYYYYGRIELNLDEGKRFVTVQFGGLDETGEITSDGSGTFAAIYFDQFLYSWPSDYVNLLLDQTEEDVIIPAFTQATHYGIFDSFLDVGVLSICCLGVEENAVETYRESLINNEYKNVGLDDFDFDNYLSKGGTVQVGLQYDLEEKILDLMLSTIEPEISEWPEENIQNALEDFFKIDEFLPSYDIEDDGYYEIDLDRYYDDGYLGIYCYTADIESIIVYKSALLLAGWTLFEEVDDFGFATYKSPSEKLAISTGYDDNEQCLSILVCSTADRSRDYTCNEQTRAALGLGINRKDTNVYSESKNSSLFDIFILPDAGVFHRLEVRFNTVNNNRAVFNVGVTIAVADKNGNILGEFFDRCSCFRQGPHLISYREKDCVSGDLNSLKLFTDDYKATRGQNYQVFVERISFN